MNKFYIVFCLFLISNLGFAQKKLTVDYIMRDPKWMGTSPTEFFWSENSRKINFKWNPDNKVLDSIYTYDISTAKIIALPKTEYSKLGAEYGVFNIDKTKKTYSSKGDLFLLDVNTNSLKKLTATVEREFNPGFSLDGQKIIFQKGSDIFTIGIYDGILSQLTDFDKGANKPSPKVNISEKWLEDQQLDLFDVLQDRKRKSDLSKTNEKPNIKKIFLDDNRLSNIEVNPILKTLVYSTIESPKNAKNSIVPNYVNSSGYTEELSARSKVGSPQSSVLSFLYHIKKDTVFKINTKDLPGLKVAPLFLLDYLKKDSVLKPYSKKVNFSNFTFSPLGSRLVCTGRSEDNKDRWIIEVDQETGKVTSLDHQHDEAWIGGPGIGFGGTFGFIDESKAYFQSEETGYSHLYIYDFDTKTKKALTSGKFEIQRVSLSKDKKTFFIHSNKEHPGEQHFYHLNVAGGDMVKITQMVGAHEVTLSPDEKFIAFRYSYSNKPWELYFQENKAGASPVQITNSISQEFKEYPWRDPKIITFNASDGQEIFGRVYQPAKSNKKAVIFVHGAGYLQNAHKWWSSYFREYMFHNLLTDLGYTVLDIDYRASAGYGRDVRTGIYRHMGGKDLSDHVDAADLLIKKYGIDKNKIGIYGGSYGGFITLMGLFTAPDVFKAGAALRPVTDWAAYNHGYTSNILNTPALDSLAYARSSPINFAASLKNNLLMCHGVVDVNVHYQDVVRLSQRLIELKKDNWELASYPVEDHGFVEPSSWTDEYKRILKLFEEKLK